MTMTWRTLKSLQITKGTAMPRATATMFMPMVRTIESSRPRIAHAQMTRTQVQIPISKGASVLKSGRPLKAKISPTAINRSDLSHGYVEVYLIHQGAVQAKHPALCFSVTDTLHPLSLPVTHSPPPQIVFSGSHIMLEVNEQKRSFPSASSLHRLLDL